MTTQHFDIDILRVASPCSADWGNMVGDDRKRLCYSCKTNVYNIAELTALEVQQLVANREGRLCIRLYRRTDGTVLTKDCPVGFRAYQKRVARFAGAALAAIFGLFSISFGQKDDKDEVRDKTIQIVRSLVQNQRSFITGMIVDPNGAIISGATLKLYSTGRKKPLTTKSGDDGGYTFSDLAPGIYRLEIKYEGFTRQVLTNIEVKKDEKLEINISLRPSNVNVTVGIYADETLIDTTSSSVRTVITRRQIENLPH